jgi:Fe-S-cluster containining protein
MPPYLKSGLTAEAASRVCMNECKAGCCQGPLVLRLSDEEVSLLEGLARSLGVEMVTARTPDGGGWLRFSDHAGERCPFLDDETFACRIYQHRPQRCRAFPERFTPGCAISGWMK